MNPIKRRNAALDAQRQKISQSLGYRLVLEEEQLHQRYLREIEMRKKEDETARRAMENVGQGALASLFGYGKDRKLASQEERRAFLYVTTDEVPEHVVIRVIGAVSGSSIRR